MCQVTLHHIEVEEQNNHQQCDDGADGDNLHGDVPLRALHAGLYIGFTAHFLGSQPYGALNDAPGLDNADDTCHGYTTDTDALGIVFENIFRSHSAYGCCDFGVPLVQYGVSPNHGHTGDDNPPYGQRTGTDDGRVFQSHNITQTEHGSTRINLEYQLGFLGQHFAEAAYAGSEILVPPAEGCHDEVV